MQLLFRGWCLPQGTMSHTFKALTLYFSSFLSTTNCIKDII
uniref:Uncharacterized protein n=1 Tax=Anguilla anguilla TaxID=7936 RepID=A0A0E9Q698_ANGAN